jgi:hypothetical protein
MLYRLLPAQEAAMGTRTRGIYRNGRVELTERPPNVPEDTNVIVTFPEPGDVDLHAHGLAPEHAVGLRARLATFAVEWDSAEMDAYDNYDALTERQGGFR